MTSHYAMVLGDLSHIMLQNVVYENPYSTKFWATNECFIYVYEKLLPSHFSV